MAQTYKSNLVVKKAKKSKYGWENLVEELIKTKKIENNSNTRIMIVSGCHGKPNGEDGFSNSETRDPNLFRKDLDLADDYHLENTNGQSIMEGYLQVIDISWFKIKDSRKIEGQIRRPDPDVIILPWNYSFGGDFHTALRKELEIKKYGLLFGKKGQDEIWEQEHGGLEIPRRPFEQNDAKKAIIVMGEINDIWIGENL